MGRITDRLFLHPRQLLSGERVEVIDAINLVLYARTPLVEARSGGDLVAGFVGRRNPDVDAIISEGHKEEILGRYRKSIDLLVFPVAPAQYQPLLEEMFECGEDVLPYFYHEYHQLADRRLRVASFGAIYGELASEFHSKALIVQQTESELSSICALGDWMTQKTLHAYLERRGVAPWWKSERNIASHARLERIGLRSWSNFEGFPYPGGFDRQNLPSFVFANTLLKYFHPRGVDANSATRIPAVSGSEESRTIEQPKSSKKQVLSAPVQALSELSGEHNEVRGTRMPSNLSPSQSQEVKRPIRDDQPLDPVKSNISQDLGQPNHLQAMPPVDDEVMLTKKEVAKLLGVSENTVSNYGKRHDDFPEPTRYSPNTLRWERSVIMKWKAAKK